MNRNNRRISRRLAWYVMACTAAGTLLLASCAPVMKVKRVHFPKHEKEEARTVEAEPGSVFYALPRTVVLADFPVKRTTRTLTKCGKAAAGNAEVADKLKKLGVSLALLAHTVDGNGTVSTRSEPDPGQVFAVDLRSRWWESQETTLSLTDTGLLSEGGTTLENQAVETGVEVFKVVAAVAASSLALTKTGDECPAKTVAILERLHTQRSAIIGQIAAKAASGLDTSVAQRALKILDNEIVSVPKVLVASTKVESSHIRCTLRPSPGDFLAKGKSPKVDDLSEGVELFRLSASGFHVVSPDCPAIGSFASRSGAVADATQRWRLRIDLADGDAVSQMKTSLKSRYERSEDTQGYFYRIPRPAGIIVAHDVRKKGATEWTAKSELAKPALIAQLGTINAFPDHLGRFGGTKYSATFFSETGALKKIVAGDTPVSKDAISGVGTAATTVLDAIEKKQDRLNKLERKKKVLEAEAAIRKLETEAAGLSLEEN